MNKQKKIDRKKVGIVLLAAGNSKRYHGIKLLDLIDGKEMYRHILEITSMLNGAPKIMVTQYEEIRNKSINYGFEIVMNENPDHGISRSIQLGLKRALEIEPNLDGVLFSVCDQPYLEKNTLERLLEVYLNSEKSMACISYDGILGNPCIIGRRFFNDLYNLEGDVGGKTIICKYIEDVAMVPAGNKNELKDIDKNEDMLGNI